MRAALVLLGSVLLLGILACGGGVADPTPITRLPAGEQIHGLHDGRVQRLTASGWVDLPEHLPRDGVGRPGPRDPLDRVLPLRDGGFVFCGNGMDGETPIDGCWRVGAHGATAVLDHPEADAAGFHVAPGGSWWNTRTLAYGRALDDPGRRLALDDVEVVRAWFSPAAQRFVVAERTGGTCRYTVVGVDRPARRSPLPLTSCASTIRWSHDGTRVAFERDDGLVIWADGEVDVVLPPSPGPDGRTTTPMLLAWSPDDTRLLIRSSRYHPLEKTWGGRVFAPTGVYVVDLDSGPWRRLDTELPHPVAWTRSPRDR